MDAVMPSYERMEGDISELYVGNANIHYLNNIRQTQKVAGVVSVLQAALGEAGAVNTAQAATAEGDAVQTFTMRVSGRLVSGSFWEVGFSVGDSVTVIGMEQGEVFEAVAVVKPEDRLIWMSPHCERGTRARKYSLIRNSLLMAAFIHVWGLIMWIFTNMPALLAVGCATLSSPIFIFVTIGLSWNDFMAFARKADAVGLALGLPDPEALNLFESTSIARKNGKPRVPIGVYYY